MSGEDIAVRAQVRRIDTYSAHADQDDLLCLLYTSDAADERSSVDLGGRRIIKKKKDITTHEVIRRSKQTSIETATQHVLIKTQLKKE